MENQQDNGPDIRKTVDDDKSILKKIQLLIPGFRGYRQKEDIRAADEILRSEIGKIMIGAISSLNNSRQSAINFNKFGALNFIGNSISSVETLQGDIVHGQQGYSGLVASVKVTDDVLNKLYEYDYEYVSKCKEIADLCSKVENIGTMNDNDVLNSLNNIMTLVNDARKVWTTRMETVEGIKE